MEPGKLIVFFDGECPLCVGWIRFLLDRDGDNRLLFSSLQSEWTRDFFRGRGWPVPDLESVLAWDGSSLHRGSDALVAIAACLPGIWNLGRHMEKLPENWRESGYRFIARRRTNWFGKRKQCWIPKEGDLAKFPGLTSSGKKRT